MSRITGIVLVLLMSAATLFAQPPIIVSPMEIDFGTVPENTTETAWLNLFNGGNATLTVEATVTGYGFTLIGETSFTIEPRDSCYYMGVAFSPDTSIVYSGEVVLLTNDPKNPEVTIPLSGTVTEPANEFDLVFPENGARGQNCP